MVYLPSVTSSSVVLIDGKVEYIRIHRLFINRRDILYPVFINYLYFLQNQTDPFEFLKIIAEEFSDSRLVILNTRYFYDINLERYYFSHRISRISRDLQERLAQRFFNINILRSFWRDFHVPDCI